MTNGLGRVSSGTGLVCCGEEKCEGVLEGSRRNVKENMQNSHLLFKNFDLAVTHMVLLTFTFARYKKGWEIKSCWAAIPRATLYYGRDTEICVDS